MKFKERILNRLGRCDCGRKAVWVYMPEPDNWIACEKCVPRGCSCNYEEGTPLGETNFRIIEPGIWVPLDLKGREYPCCEWEKI